MAWWMILGGVLEAHPGLKVAFIEGGSEWVVPLLRDLDDRVFGAKGFSGYNVWPSKLPMKPSEYWRRQCYVGASQILWGADLPHGDSTWGRTLPYIQASIGAAKVPEDEARIILGGNLVRAYDLDVEALAPVVEQFGPTIDDIDAPPLAPLPPLLEWRVSRPLSRASF
jgi:predicted TIM-barrel fold metal-dependent hydrolase